MSAVVGTLPFLATLWLLVVLGAMVLEESGAKIAAALKGKAAGQPMIRLAPARSRARPRALQAAPVERRWRAAA